MGLWSIPILLILIEAAIFLGKANWGSDYVIYFVTFWILRVVLSPLIVLFTLKFWVDHRKWLRLFLVHVAGFTLFSLIFWSLAYFILHDLLQRSEFFGVERTSTNIGIFGMLVDNSISTNTIVYVSTTAFCYIWEFFHQNIQINRKAMELERSLNNSRLELLKGQLNAHFLFNTLHTISSLVVRGQNAEANKTLMRLSELLRFSLRENKEQLIPLSREIELLQLYLDIQQTRFRDRLEVSLKVPAETENILFPSMLLQPLVENAVKYAIEPYSDKGIIDIDIHTMNGSLFISIKDNGRMEFDKIDFNSGIGLNNTKERLDNLYPGEHKFSVQQNGEKGVTVAIEIPNQKIEHAAVESTYSG
jgi:two-component sensor histidine kinase